MARNRLDMARIWVQPGIQTFMKVLGDVSEEANRRARTGYRLYLGLSLAPHNRRKLLWVRVQILLLQEVILP